MPGLEGVTIKKVACGWRHSVIVDDTGQIWTFGWSRYGQLGHGANTYAPACLSLCHIYPAAWCPGIKGEAFCCRDEPLAKRVAALTGTRVSLICGGWRHTLAADESGKLYAWGWNKVHSFSGLLPIYAAS